ncbi:DUF4301 family protein [Maribellus mangrovi]|uniref:DUF4301 family protein n=1 Tax=Maribellus mangrovi TaxID=3133146 RepID=UPI0030EC9C88
MDFNHKDLHQIAELGISVEEVESQICRYINGFPDLNLFAPVEPGNGLRKLTPKEVDAYISLFEEQGIKNELVKFVPASGAASRMFKMLYNFLEGAISVDDNDVKQFYDGLSNFAFYDELLESLGSEANNAVEVRDKKVVTALLTEKGLNYGFLPKALLTFHKYADGKVTKAIDEHLIEGAFYGADEDGVVKLHFTVSSEHMDLIKEHIARVKPVYKVEFGKRYEITYSIQDKATDTLAVDLNNAPFRKENGELLFRPGGHGALLKNLNAIKGDIVFIKNIDNVAAQWLIKDTIDYKKALGGVLVEAQNKVFEYCKLLENVNTIDEDMEQELLVFIEEQLGYKMPESFAEKTHMEKPKLLFKILNRPIRICGVVESSGTGGGPFWVLHKDGTQTLQLVETAQVNLKKEDQVAILNASCYANITDLVCGVKNYQGEAFDLMQFRDPDTGFIAEKSAGGKTLKAMELPGLWNGAMSNWNTVFVEVPMTTFNPVKTVLDLLKKEHQG